MATTFKHNQPLGGLPPKHVIEAEYTPSIPNLILKEEALETIKRTFEDKLKKNVNLVRVSAPMFVQKTSGFNDNLNGVERPATFAPRDYAGTKLEVPFSLAKWKHWLSSTTFSKPTPALSPTSVVSAATTTLTTLTPSTSISSTGRSASPRMIVTSSTSRRPSRILPGYLRNRTDRRREIWRQARAPPRDHLCVH